MSETPWEKIMNFMTPGNLEGFDIFSKQYSGLAKCLGIGPKYDNYSTTMPGVNCSFTTQLNEMMLMWRRRQKSLDNIAENFIKELESGATKTQLNLEPLITE